MKIICREVPVTFICCARCNKVIKIGCFYRDKAYPLYAHASCPYCGSHIGMLIGSDGSSHIYGGSFTQGQMLMQRIDVEFKHDESNQKKEIFFGAEEIVNEDIVAQLNLQTKKNIEIFKEVDNIELIKLSLHDKGNLPRKDKKDRLIEKFGMKFGQQNENKLKKIQLNQQVVYLGNSPIEWALVDGVPLSFLYDVCRLPIGENNCFKKYLNNDVEQQYSIKPGVENKTWVLMCSSNDPIMMAHYNMQIESFKQSGFTNYSIVHSKKELLEIIRDEDIDILILDSHGGFSQETSSSFLWIEGKEKLEYDDIIEIKKSIPIVFLSACSTNPPIKIEKNIAEAFLYSGSLSVVASHVPLSIYQGMQIICRLVNNLIYASRCRVHINWLDFISHLMRTFKCQIKIHEPYQQMQSRFKSFLWRMKEFCDDDIKAKINKLIRKEEITLDEIKKICENKVLSEAFEKEMFQLQSEIEEKEWNNVIGNIKKLNLDYDRRIEEIQKTGEICLLYALEHEICQLHPEKRSEIYKMWYEDDSIKNTSEFLYYTHLGRPDCISFEFD